MASNSGAKIYMRNEQCNILVSLHATGHKANHLVIV